MAKQILRMTKLKTMANIAGSLNHTYRTNTTHNADPKRAGLNSHTQADAGLAMGEVQKRLEGLKIRSNAVRCLEFLVTASPDFFEKRPGDSYFENARKWLEKKFGLENVVSHHVHRDESTPHAIFYVVPIDKKTGKLNARGYVGGSRSVLSDLQDSFFETVSKKYGLERGQKGSKAKHQTVKKFYESLKKPVPPAPTRAKLILMSDDEKLQSIKDLHAHSIKNSIYAAKLENERQKIISENDDLQATNERLNEVIMDSKNERDLIYKATARLIKNAYTPAEFAKNMGVEIKGKEDVFDALIKSGKASDFKDAITQVALKMPSKTDSKWSDLARFTVDFDKADPIPNPQVLGPVKTGLNRRVR
jgi:hypothetical protein